MKLEIVSHVYCPPGMSHYAEMLKWQWLFLERAKLPALHMEVELLVCMTSQDEVTCRVVDELILQTQHFDVIPYCLPPEQLFRRSIGRNMRAKETDADYLWFADVDYFCTGDFLEAFRNKSHDRSLMFPSECRRNITHDMGDKMIAGSIHLDESLFETVRFPKAIGGVQFIASKLVADCGYNDGTKWVEPVDPAKGFRQCKGDIAWRKRMVKFYGAADRFTADGLYRIRHTVDGRDLDLAGVKGDGKENW